MAKKVCIIGAGNGALAAAADLTLRGFRVTLYKDQRFRANVEEIMETGVIHCIGAGPVGAAKIYKVTYDLEEALDDIDIIMPVIPAYSQEYVARTLLPYIKPYDKIVLAPGSTGGALVFAKIFHENGKIDRVRISEMHTLPYAARKVNNCTVKILLECKKIFFASFPSVYNEEMVELVKELYPAIELAEDVLETSLNNGNAVSHPAPVVLNAGKIEYFHQHFHY